MAAVMLILSLLAISLFIRLCMALLRGQWSEFIAEWANILGKLRWWSFLVLFAAFAVPVYFVSNFQNSLQEGTYGFQTYVQSDSGTYTLPAKINMKEISYESEDSWGNHRVESYLYPFLEAFYWPNGGYCTFDDVEIRFDEPVSVSSVDGEDYIVTLTDTPVSHYMIQETDHSHSIFEIADLIIGFMIGFDLLFVFVIQCYNSNKKQ